jgi:riboflavin biosynthesis pyrimidine reductase
MKLRQGSDAILVGINTILADDPSLTVRKQMADGRRQKGKPIRRIILDSKARTPPNAKIVSDEFAALTTIVAGKAAPKNRVAALSKKVNVIVAPAKKSQIADRRSQIDLRWLLKKLGAEMSRACWWRAAAR